MWEDGCELNNLGLSGQLVGQYLSVWPMLGAASLFLHNLYVGCNLQIRIFISDKWSPALQIRTVLLSIQALLSAPNPDDPLANDVAEQWKINESQAIEIGIVV